MRTSLDELMSHIEDPNDRRLLADLIRRHEVLRVRLLLCGVNSRVAERDERIATLEGQLQRERSVAEEWRKQYQKNRTTIALIDRVLAEGKQVAEENKRLKGQLARVLHEWEPSTKVLFQEAG